MESDAALWQAVYDAPDDDAPREVLADVLQERGDPRGELIALQLREHRGDASAEASARATQLVKQWGEHWLGALRAIADHAALKRGCLHQITLTNYARSSHWDVFFQDPSFSTVEEIDVRYPDELFAKVLASPASANLRAITINSAGGWHGLTSRRAPSSADTDGNDHPLRHLQETSPTANLSCAIETSTTLATRTIPAWQAISNARMCAQFEGDVQPSSTIRMSGSANVRSATSVPPIPRLTISVRPPPTS